MTVNQSFSGNIVNPIADARLKMAFSGPALAKRLGLSRQYISRAEQGTYSSLNPALVKWVSNALQISSTAVFQRYVQFQKTKRNASLEETRPHRLIRNDGNTEPGYVLFERWRSGYWPSSLAFANAFCIHPETIRNYEEGIRPEMPGQVKTILQELNLVGENWTEHPLRDEATDDRLSA